MAIEYAVLWGQRGVKDGFRKIARARDFAKKKANKLKKTVSIDKITTYPHAKVGMSDWSQSHYTDIKPDIKKKKGKKR